MPMTNEEYELRFNELKCLYDGNEGAEGGEIHLREDQLEFLGIEVGEDERSTGSGGYMTSTPLFLEAFEKLADKPRTKAEGMARKAASAAKPVRPNPNAPPGGFKPKEDLKEKSPTIEEFLEAGYHQENYPPEGHEPQKSKLNPQAKAGKDLSKITKEDLAKVRK